MHRTPVSAREVRIIDSTRSARSWPPVRAQTSIQDHSVVCRPICIVRGWSSPVPMNFPSGLL